MKLRRTDWADLPGDDFVVIEGYKSGIDAATNLAAAGKACQVLASTHCWNSDCLRHALAGNHSSRLHAPLRVIAVDKLESGGFGVALIVLTPHCRGAEPPQPETVSETEHPLPRSPTNPTSQVRLGRDVGAFVAGAGESPARRDALARPRRLRGDAPAHRGTAAAAAPACHGRRHGRGRQRGRGRRRGRRRRPPAAGRGLQPPRPARGGSSRGRSSAARARGSSAEGRRRRAPRGGPRARRPRARGHSGPGEVRPRAPPRADRGRDRGRVPRPRRTRRFSAAGGEGAGGEARSATRSRRRDGAPGGGATKLAAATGSGTATAAPRKEGGGRRRCAVVVWMPDLCPDCMFWRGGGKLEFRHEATDYFSFRIVLRVGLIVLRIPKIEL